MELHLLWASQGEYSDRTEWAIAVYTRKEDAEADTALAGQLWREITKGEDARYSARVMAKRMASENGRALAAIMGLGDGETPCFFGDITFYCSKVEVRNAQAIKAAATQCSPEGEGAKGCAQ